MPKKGLEIKNFEPPEKYIRLAHEEKRKDKHENVKHVLSAILIVPYIFLLLTSCLWKFEIPKAYETLALIVIGYYFAKHL